MTYYTRILGVLNTLPEGEIFKTKDLMALLDPENLEPPRGPLYRAVTQLKSLGAFEGYYTLDLGDTYMGNPKILWHNKKDAI